MLWVLILILIYREPHLGIPDWRSQQYAFVVPQTLGEWVMGRVVKSSQSNRSLSAMDTKIGRCADKPRRGPSRPASSEPTNGSTIEAGNIPECHVLWNYKLSMHRRYGRHTDRRHGCGDCAPNWHFWA